MGGDLDLKTLKKQMGFDKLSNCRVTLKTFQPDSINHVNESCK